MNKKKIIILLDIIVISILLISYYNYRIKNDNNKNQNTTNEQSTNDTQKIQYKHFEFEISKNIKFSEDNKYTFVLETTNWKAYITIIYDKQNEVMNNAETYYNYLKKEYPMYNLERINNIKISNANYNLCIRNSENNYAAGAIGVSHLIGDFIYQVDFISLTNEFTPKQIEPIVKIMQDVKVNNEVKKTVYYIPASYIMNTK